MRIDHLLHLVNVAELDPGEKKDLITALKADAPSGIARKNAIDRLENLKAGTHKRLRDLWTAYGRQTLFLFEVPRLADWSITEAKNELFRGLKLVGMNTRGFRSDGNWVEVARLDDEPDNLQTNGGTITGVRTLGVAAPVLSKERVHKVALKESILSAIVRIRRTITVVQEDEEISIPITYDVQVVIDFESPSKLARVFGAQTDGRKALRTVLRFLGLDVPERGPSVPKFMRPVIISELKLRAFALKQKWEWVDVSGADAAGKLGRIGYSGKTPTPLKRAQLDMSDVRVKAQDIPGNESRTYNFRYLHVEDGFEEVSEAEFLFGVRQTRFGFPRRATRPAMDNLISMVYEHVR
ncbi:hypothetical protein [Corallococcus sp. RDP092CA]|uniref:hypothetical protein n=1 Tax=Corallococcus sp. RDP092CA TaxID=3109369 RepID=UPI0035B413DD